MLSLSKHLACSTNLNRSTILITAAREMLRQAQHDVLLTFNTNPVAHAQAAAGGASYILAK